MYEDINEEVHQEMRREVDEEVQEEGHVSAFSPFSPGCYRLQTPGCWLQLWRTVYEVESSSGSLTLEEQTVKMTLMCINKQTNKQEAGTHCSLGSSSFQVCRCAARSPAAGCCSDSGLRWRGSAPGSPAGWWGWAAGWYPSEEQE